MRLNPIYPMLIMVILLSGCIRNEYPDIKTFEDCLDAGYPITESYPPQCRTPDGKTYTQKIEFDLISCTEEEKKADACTLEYMPVCGDNGMTYGNKCSGCSSGEIDSFYYGECRQQDDKKYLTRDPEECNVMGVWQCEEGMRLFSDETGCGCMSIGDDGGLIGGETDEHGCLTPAGYSWDQDIDACVRSWELNTEEKEAARIAVLPQSYRPITVVDVVAGNCEGCYAVKIERGDTGSQSVVLVEGSLIGEGGLLDGTIDIGPLCPVESDPPDPRCGPTLETYKAWPIMIYDSKGVKVAEKTGDEYGLFETVLKPGNYTIKTAAKSGIGSSNLPLDIKIVSGGITYVSLTIDTGIR